MTSRIYIVTNGAADPRLVKASQDQLVAALTKGVKVEEAKAEDTE